jgi:signal transduction histidine kinase
VIRRCVSPLNLVLGSFSENPVEGRGMTLGTSTQGGTLFHPGAEAMEHRGARRWPAHAIGFRINWPWLARGAAALHLFGLALIVTMGWHDPTVTGSATIGGLPALHLAFLMMTGAAAALLTLSSRREEQTLQAADDAQPGVDQLLAQMSHELRTPLNAMIGFSEVMLRELYGPLGHARYQEYAAHISESGGQLLRSAEDALAVTETMSAPIAAIGRGRAGGHRDNVGSHGRQVGRPLRTRRGQRAGARGMGGDRRLRQHN